MNVLEKCVHKISGHDCFRLKSYKSNVPMQWEHSGPKKKKQVARSRSRDITCKRGRVLARCYVSAKAFLRGCILPPTSAFSAKLKVFKIVHYTALPIFSEKNREF